MDKFSAPTQEAGKLKVKLAVAWILSIPVILLQYAFPYIPYREYVQLVLSVPVLFYSGSSFFQGAYQTIRMHTGNMDLLVALGAATAFFFSLFVTLDPHGIPGASVYFDASVFIVTLILTGGYIESVTKARANSAASKLKKLMPEKANLISDNGEIIETSLNDISPGNRIMCKPGDIIPVDGRVLEGRSEIDQSLITGEQMPVLKGAGDHVDSGTTNLNGILKIQVERVGSESTINQVYQLIQLAAQGRVKMQRIADVFSSAFIPIVIVAALAAGAFWFSYLSIYSHQPAFEYAILAFVSVVVIACPCAIGLAAPITLLIASSASSEKGVLLKNSNSLERLSKTSIVLFDKTGTLTFPDPVIETVSSAGMYSTDEILTYAASIESNSNHPIARSIVKEAVGRGLKIGQGSDIIETPGAGISGNFNGKTVQVSRAEGHGSSMVSVTINNVNAGSISLSYKTRDTAAEAIKSLKSMQIKSAMITGDSRGEAGRIGSILGIDDIHAEVIPQDKAEIVKSYQAQGLYVAFVGDGINDSIALETADVGIAMGSGLDVARESGDIILLNDDLSGVPFSIVLGGATIAKIRQNIWWAIGYNSALIPVAGGILVPLFGLSIFSLLPILAALAMGLSSSSVVLNSLRLRRRISRSAIKYLQAGGIPGRSTEPKAVA